MIVHIFALSLTKFINSHKLNSDRVATVVRFTSLLELSVAAFVMYIKCINQQYWLEWNVLI